MAVQQKKQMLYQNRLVQVYAQYYENNSNFMLIFLFYFITEYAILITQFMCGPLAKLCMSGNSLHVNLWNATYGKIQIYFLCMPCHVMKNVFQHLGLKQVNELAVVHCVYVDNSCDHTCISAPLPFCCNCQGMPLLLHHTVR